MGHIASIMLTALMSQTTTINVVDIDGAPLKDAILVSFSTDVEQLSESSKHSMEQVNRQFSPQLLVINSGDTVSFPNNDTVRHHVYSFSRPRPFEIELYSAGESPSIDFPDLGVVVVGCNIHDQMEGYIIIGSGSYARSNERGKLEVPNNFNTREDWYIWHPWMLKAGKQPIPFSESKDTFQVQVSKPSEARTSELESRFRSRELRGGN